MDRLLRVLMVAAVAMLAPHVAMAAAGSLAAPEDAWHLCADKAREIERREHLPETILEAITTVETAKPIPGESSVRPWPWTVTAEGKGAHYDSLRSAIAAVTALRARGIESIDVGCMQVNLHFHPGAFTSLEEAFNPASNMNYAVSLLKSLKETYGTWEAAIEHYHSFDPTLRLAYRLKVFASWQTISHEREEFRLASEVSLERLGAHGDEVKPTAPAEGPILASRDARHRTVRAGFLGGSVIHLTGIEPDSGESQPAPMVMIAVDLRPQPSDRPGPGDASIFGGGTVAAAEPNFKPTHD